MSHEPDAFAGVKEIVQYNRHQYLAATAVFAASTAAASSKRLPKLLRLAAGLVAAGTAALSIGSLAATHWVYDRSKLRKWYWLDDLVGGRPDHWVNLHCGLNEASGLLSERWGPPSSVLDIFDADVMTEPSIRRARQLGKDSEYSVRAAFRDLPIEDESQDAVLAIFCLHELRKRADREAAFCEIARVLSHNGRLILVEHLRDQANFAAYGPGAMHFWPREEWLSLAESCGLFLVSEASVTPFVRGFAFARLA